MKGHSILWLLNKNMIGVYLTMNYMEDKIDSKNVEDILALTPLQQGILYESLLYENNCLYLEQLSINLAGSIDFKMFEEAWNLVVDSNELLRTIFRWEGLQKPLQIILKKHKIPIVYHDFSTHREQEQSIIEMREFDKKTKIDLKKAPFRITLCQLSDTNFELMISSHHILYDGWSTGIVLKEFLGFYNNLCKSEEIIRVKKGKYKDYVKYLLNQDLKKHRDYWQEHLKNNEVKTKLPYINEASKESLQYKDYSFTFNDELQDKINNTIKNYKISPACFFYGVWGLLLQRYNNSNNVLLGTTVTVRPESIEMIDNMIGLFINTIPLAIDVNGNENLEEYFKTIQTNIIEREKYSNTPLVDIKASSQLDKKNRLFESVVVVENYPLDTSLTDENNIIKINGFKMTETPEVPLMLEIFTKDKLELKFLYNESLFNREDIERINGHFVRTIEHISEQPFITINRINILTKEEMNKVLVEFNQYHFKYSKEKLVHEMFEERVYKSPHSIAAIFEDRKMTYRELNERANSLARVLRRNGIRNGITVGLIVERSFEMLIGMLAVFKSGGTLITIDPDLPIDRKRYMIQDSNTSIILVSNNREQFNCKSINIFDENLYQYDTEDLENINNLKDLAYIIYTSGSTGKPKGVMIEHLAVVDFVEGHTKTLQFSEGDIICAVSTVSFDIFFVETLLSLVKGLQVVIASRKDLEEPDELIKLINRNKVDILQTTPSRMTMLLKVDRYNEMFRYINKIMLGGDVFTHKLLNELRKKGNVSIYNLYGPTETTVWATMKDLTTSDQITIGKPFLNKEVYILNKNNNLQPIGVAGELCIAGECLSLGYLNKEELTKKKFIENPYKKGGIYKTGDLARWLPNGELEFIGRVDCQVKVQGYRIELGEIQSVIYSYPKDLETVVLVKENVDKEKYICAYIATNENICIEDLRKHILEQLPMYMCPALFVLLEKMPLTMSGKVDRKALPEPEDYLWVSNTYEAPRNDIERNLVSMWKDILGCDREIGIHDDFFELGGQSLKVISLVGRIHKEYNIKIPIRDVFELSTISKIAEYIVQSQKVFYSSIKKAEEKEYYPISSAQKRLFVLNQFNKSLTNYNMPSAFIIEGQLDVKRLKGAFSSLIDRHESLRTSFDIVEGEVVQMIHNKVPIEFSYKHEGEKQLDYLLRDFIRPFDLMKAPLVRIHLIKFRATKYVLLIDMHHIISDGESTLIMIDEIIKLYNGVELKEPIIQYKDYVLWQNEMIGKGELAEQEKYWLQCFKDDIPVLNLPFDFERPSIQNYEGAKVVYEIDEILYSKLKEISDSYNITLYTVLLAAYYTLLYKYTNQTDISIGSPVSGRTHTNLEKVVGMFVNTLVLRNRPQGNNTFLEFMMEVNESILRAMDNQDYPLENLLEKLHIKRTSNRNPLFDTVFVLLNKENVEQRLDNLKVTPHDIRLNISKFDLLLTANHFEGELVFELEYASSLFLEESMKRMLERYVSILKQITVDNSIKLDDIQVLTELKSAEIHIDPVTFEF